MHTADHADTTPLTVLTGGRIVTPDAILEGYDLVLRGDRVAAIAPATDATAGRVDVAGAWIIPGLIDIHADYIEHMAAPRPTSIMDFRFALRQAERELIAHGITTMYHSLAIYDYTEFSQSPIRTVDNTRRLIDLIAAFHDDPHIIHHRFHARFELDNLGRVEELREYITTGRLHLLSFMDHTPGQGQYRNLELYRKTVKGYRNATDDQIDQYIAQSQARPKLTLETVAELTDLATRHGIAVASHDDDTVAKVDLVRGTGATISEFPITMEVAHHARALGMHTVAGAPNVLLGGSHSGNLGAAEAIAAGAVDVLCSDYYPAALLQAIWTLYRSGGAALPAMVRLATCNAAEAVRIADEVGSLEVGLRADVLVVDEIEEGLPVVRAAYVAGRPVYSGAYRPGAAQERP